MVQERCAVAAAVPTAAEERDLAQAQAPSEGLTEDLGATSSSSGQQRHPGGGGGGGGGSSDSITCGHMGAGSGGIGGGGAIGGVEHGDPVGPVPGYWPVDGGGGEEQSRFSSIAWLIDRPPGGSPI